MANVENLFILSGLFFGKEKNQSGLNLQEKFVYEYLLPRIKNLSDSTGKGSYVILLGNILYNKYSFSSISFYRLYSLLLDISKIVPVCIVLSEDDIIYKKNQKFSILDVLNLYNVHIVKDYMDLVLNDKHIRLVSYDKDFQKVRNYLYESNKMSYDLFLFPGDIINYINYSNKSISVNNIKLLMHYGKENANIKKVNNLFNKEISLENAKNDLGFYIVNISNDVKLFYVENEISPKFVILEYKDFQNSNIEEVLKNKYCFIKIRSNEERDNIMKYLNSINNFYGYEFIDDIILEHINNKKENIKSVVDLNIYLKEYLDIYIKDENLKLDIYNEIKKHLYGEVV